MVANIGRSVEDRENEGDGGREWGFSENEGFCEWTRNTIERIFSEWGKNESEWEQILIEREAENCLGFWQNMNGWGEVLGLDLVIFYFFGANTKINEVKFCFSNFLLIPSLNSVSTYSLFLNFFILELLETDLDTENTCAGYFCL
jgi:hypothetical protein